MMKALIPDLTEVDLLVDRTHRIPKPKFLQAHVPQCTLVQIVFFKSKERLPILFHVTNIFITSVFELYHNYILPLYLYVDLKPLT